MCKCLVCAECGPKAAGILNRPKTGTVLAAFSKAIYMDLEGSVLMLCGQDAARVPFGIYADGSQDLFTNSSNYSGAELRFTDDVLILNGCFEIDMLDALVKAEAQQACHSDPVSFSGDALRDALTVLEKEGSSFLKAVVTGKSCSDPLFETCNASVQAICRLSQTDNKNSIAKALESCIGLGRGLTPSMDDFLTGFLCCAAMLDPQHEKIKHAIFELSARLAPKLTNSISAAFITAAAEEEPFGVLQDVLRARPGSVRFLLDQGSGSGSEMLTGAIAAAKVLSII